MFIVYSEMYGQMSVPMELFDDAVEFALESNVPSSIVCDFDGVVVATVEDLDVQINYPSYVREGYYQEA